MIYKILIMFHFIFMIFVSVNSSAPNNSTTDTTPFLCTNHTIQPSTDPQTGVQSKDVKISPTVSGRLFIPKYLPPFLDLPVILYFHGGADFCSGTAFSLPYHNFSNSLSNKTNAVVLSVEYRPPPANQIPVAYNDSWDALQWVARHANGTVDEPWLEDFADFKRVFLAGDGAGANIAHNMAMRVGSWNLSKVNVVGLVLIHPLLWGENPVLLKEPEGRELVSKTWKFLCQNCSGLDDPRLNPAVDPNLKKLGCEKVMVFVAGLDPAAKGNNGYVEALRESGWKGEVVSVEAVGKKNGFYLNPNYTKSYEDEVMMKQMSSFIN